MLLTAPSHAACGDDLLFVRFRGDIARASGACAFGENDPQRSGRHPAAQQSLMMQLDVEPTVCDARKMVQ
jgi:hypothetical protein